MKTPSIEPDPELDAGSWRSWHGEDSPIRLGVSSCLLGEAVRFDGGHTRDAFVTEVLGPWVEWIPTCPEVDLGMGVPRPTIRLVQSKEGERLVAPSTGEDFTDRMNAYAERKAKELGGLDVDGYVLKKSSPSCGLERISVYSGENRAHRRGVGLYAQALLRRHPHLPVEEEGRLNDPVLRKNFIERVFCRHRWRTMLRRGKSRRRLVEFHTAHKMLLRAHNEAGYARLGRIVASAKKISDAELFDRYEEALQTTMRWHANVKRHVNVLQHALGYLKEQLDAAEKREVLAAIEDYRRGLLPLIAPVTLLRFLVRKWDVEYLRGQVYLDPHPKELMLRNHC